MDLCTNNQGLWHKKSLVWVRFGQGFFVLKITLLCAKFVLVLGAYFSFFVMILKLVTMAFFFHGFRVLKADSISNVFSPGFFGTKVEVFGPWFLCAHFSMDLTSKIIYPLLVGGGSPNIYYICRYTLYNISKPVATGPPPSK